MITACFLYIHFLKIIPPPPSHSLSPLVGLLLGGEASYEAYARLISPMINDLHGGFNTSTMVQPAVDANFKLLQDFLPRMEAFDTTFVEQAVIMGSRNIYGYPLLPACDRKTRRSVEYILKTAFQRRLRDLGGKYYSLVSLNPVECEAIDNDPLGLLPAGMYKSQPTSQQSRAITDVLVCAETSH